MNDWLKIALLISQLNSPSWKERETATIQLAKMPLAWPVCQQMRSDNPEIQARLNQIAAPWQELYIQQTADKFRVTGWPYLPQVDFVYGRFGIPEEGELRYYFDLAGPGEDDYLYYGRYRRATRLWLEDQIHLGVPAKVIQGKLEAAVKMERAWLEGYGVRDSWPKEIREAMGK